MLASAPRRSAPARPPARPSVAVPEGRIAVLTDGDGRARGDSWLAAVLGRRVSVVVIRPVVVTTGVSMATIEPMGGGFVEVYGAVEAATREHEARARANVATLGDALRRAGIPVAETTAPYAPSMSGRRTRRRAARAVLAAACEAGVGEIVIGAVPDFSAELDALVARNAGVCLVEPCDDPRLDQARCDETGYDDLPFEGDLSFDDVADLWTDLGGEA